MALNPKSSRDLPSQREARVPSDLRPEESDLAAWFECLEHPAAPDRIRAAVLEGGIAVGAVPRERSGWLRAFPLGAWGVASAAILLVALGIAVTVEFVDPVVPPAQRALVGTSGQAMLVVEDGSMPLFHDLETFDEVGLTKGELIADWGR